MQERRNSSALTRMPAFWDTPRCPMITHTSDSHQIPSQKKTKSKLQILKNCQKLKKNLQETLHVTHILMLLERLCSEIPPAALWLTHTSDSHQIPSQKKTKSKLQNFKKLLKIQILKFCKKLYMRHTFWSCLMRYINMKWIQREL